MKNSIGICTRYDRNELAYVATTLADWFTENFYRVSIFAVNTQPTVQQGKQWDTQLVTHRICKFSDWVSTVNSLIWTHIPTQLQLDYTKTTGIQNYIIIDPDQIKYMPKDELAILQQMWRVITLSRVSQAYCYQLGLRNTAVVPMHSGLPVYCKNAATLGTLPVLFWPMFDGDWQRYNNAAFTTMEKLLQEHSDWFFLHIGLSSRDIPAEYVRLFQEWRKRFPNVVLKTCRKLQWRHLLYQSASLIYWPTVTENAMLRALQAYSMSTPVIGFGMQPMMDVLTVTPELIVPVNARQQAQNGTFRLLPETTYKQLGKVVVDNLYSSAALRAARRDVAEFCVTRRQEFNECMTELFV